jgi:hypothetical protein
MRSTTVTRRAETDHRSCSGAPAPGPRSMLPSRLCGRLPADPSLTPTGPHEPPSGQPRSPCLTLRPGANRLLLAPTDQKVGSSNPSERANVISQDIGDRLNLRLWVLPVVMCGWVRGAGRWAGGCGWGRGTVRAAVRGAASCTRERNPPPGAPVEIAERTSTDGVHRRPRGTAGDDLCHFSPPGRSSAVALHVSMARQRFKGRLWPGALVSRD